MTNSDEEIDNASSDMLKTISTLQATHLKKKEDTDNSSLNVTQQNLKGFKMNFLQKFKKINDDRKIFPINDEIVKLNLKEFQASPPLLSKVCSYNSTLTKNNFFCSSNEKLKPTMVVHVQKKGMSLNKAMLKSFKKFPSRNSLAHDVIYATRQHTLSTELCNSIKQPRKSIKEINPYNLEMHEPPLSRMRNMP
jgi:hypothetical protein